MPIWVDADACPLPIKQILLRAAQRTNIEIIFVANQIVNIPLFPTVKRIQVGAGFDVADNYIVEHLIKNDLVITADIPLADLVVAKLAYALNPRGEWYTEKNIKQRLAMRDLSESLRSSGKLTGGPATLSKAEITRFANRLDQWLTQNKVG